VDNTQDKNLELRRKNLEYFQNQLPNFEKQDFFIIHHSSATLSRRRPASTAIPWQVRCSGQR
jgi:hypothetical protein